MGCCGELGLACSYLIPSLMTLGESVNNMLMNLADDGKWGSVSERWRVEGINTNRPREIRI